MLEFFHSVLFAMHLSVRALRIAKNVIFEQMTLAPFSHRPAQITKKNQKTQYKSNHKRNQESKLCLIRAHLCMARRCFLLAFVPKGDLTAIEPLLEQSCGMPEVIFIIILCTNLCLLHEDVLDEVLIVAVAIAFLFRLGGGGSVVCRSVRCLLLPLMLHILQRDDRSAEIQFLSERNIGKTTSDERKLKRKVLWFNPPTGKKGYTWIV